MVSLVVIALLSIVLELVLAAEIATGAGIKGIEGVILGPIVSVVLLFGVVVMEGTEALVGYVVCQGIVVVALVIRAVTSCRSIVLGPSGFGIVCFIVTSVIVCD
jgi:hypothetical protein